MARLILSLLRYVVERGNLMAGEQQKRLSFLCFIQFCDGISSIPQSTTTAVPHHEPVTIFRTNRGEAIFLSLPYFFGARRARRRRYQDTTPLRRSNSATRRSNSCATRRSRKRDGKNNLLGAKMQLRDKEKQLREAKMLERR
jgi:hypothetical protein